jgi:hypothetical protein
MRKFRIYYYIESNDECVDRELDIECNDIEMALHLFKKEVRVYKRVYKIEEI